MTASQVKRTLHGSVSIMTNQATLRRIAGTKEDLNVLSARSLGMCKKIVGQIQISKQTSWRRKKVENLFFSFQSVKEEKNDVWYLDSSCSNHMTLEKDIFLDMDNSFISKVKMGNGVVVDVKGKGSIGVQMRKGRRKVIRDVLFVPELGQNLLSLEGKIMEIKMVQQRSFPLTFQYAKEVGFKADLVDENWLWYQRYGHLNF